MSIQHGEDLIVAINGNAAMASKSCDIDVSVGTIEKSSPTSGEWKEYVPDRKGWTVKTDHLILSGTSFFHEGITDPCTVNATNNKNDGGRLWADSQYSSSDTATGADNGIYIYALNCRTGVLIDSQYFVYASPAMKTYLNSNTFTAADVVIVIMNKGGVIIEEEFCTLLEEKFRIPMPVVSFGYYLTDNDYRECETPLIMMGSRNERNMPQGMIFNNEESNTLKVIFDIGQVSVADGITGKIEMVGRECALHMKGKDGSILAGTGICKQFRVSATKGHLMQGAFSWQGNGELQTNAYRLPQGDAIHVVNYITIDMNKTNPLEMISGDVNGYIIEQIRRSTHRYMCRNTAEGEMSICQLSDDNQFFYEDGAQTQGGGVDGDVFVIHPPFYTEAVEIADRVWRVGFSLVSRGAGWVEHPRGDIIGAYPGVATTGYDNTTIATDFSDISNIYLRSLALPWTVEKVKASYNTKTMAANRGAGFSIVRVHHMNLVAMLFFAIYGRTDCRNVCGGGVERTVLPDPSLFLPMRDSVAASGISNGVSFMGLIDWWQPNIYEELDAQYLGSTDVMRIVKADGTTRDENIVNTGDEYIVPLVMKMGINLDMLPIAGQSNTDDMKGFTTSFRTGASAGMFRGGQFPGLAAMSVGSNDRANYEFSRLAFKGTLVEYSSSQEFLSLPIYDPTT